MPEIKQTVFDSFEQEESEYTKRTKDCIGGLTDTIPLGQAFTITDVEILNSVYEEKPTKTAILKVESGKLKGEMTTGSKKILTILERKNSNGVTMIDYINQGNKLTVKLEKTKNKTNNFYSHGLLSA